MARFKRNPEDVMPKTAKKPKTTPYYKTKKSWRDHEEILAGIKMLEEWLKSDPEAKYFIGAGGGFLAAGAIEALKAAGFTFGEETPEETKKQLGLSLNIFNALKGGGSIDAAQIGALGFSGFCMLILLMKNLDGVAKVIEAGAGVIEAIVPL